MPARAAWQPGHGHGCGARNGSAKQEMEKKVPGSPGSDADKSKEERYSKLCRVIIWHLASIEGYHKYFDAVTRSLSEFDIRVVIN